MKKKIFIVLFLLFLGCILALAQQSPHSHKWETKKMLGDQPERRDHIFDERNVLIKPTYHKSFNEDSIKLNAIIPDFQVNENAGPNGADQEWPSICTDGSGNFVITWVDSRNGRFLVAAECDIYAQRYSSDGTASGPNFRVNDNQANAYYEASPSISADDSGNFVITWLEYDYGEFDIYAQRYSSDGSVLGTNFRVNDDQGSVGYRGFPSISTDNVGNFVITWEDQRDDWGGDIYAQRYSNDGTALGTNFKVNDDHGGEIQRDPCISTDNVGNFVITWEDKRAEANNIYAQRYSSDGTALGVNFKVNDDQGIEWHRIPSISTDNVGNFVITWGDNRHEDYDIYAQRYSNNGTALGTNIKVNDDQGHGYQDFPSICTDNSGGFMITWLDSRNGILDIYAQRYSNDGTALGTNFKVDNDQGSAYQNHPAISPDGNSNFVITWEDYRHGDIDIYAQRYSNDGTASGTNFKVNDDQGSASQHDPSISIDGDGNFVMIWEDYRNGDADIYAQRYSSDGTALGVNFKVNEDQTNVYHLSPSISTDNVGNFVITWEDWRNGDRDIYAQRYLNDGNASGTNFRVNDDQGSSNQYNPSISTNGSGDFVITWKDRRDGDNDIYAQRYSSDGSALGANFKVNDIQGGAGDPSISMNNRGYFVITWEDRRTDENGRDIYAQRYSSDGSALGANFKVNNDQGGVYQAQPSVSTDNSGSFVITWWDRRNANFDIYAQCYLSDGTAYGTNFQVNDDQGDVYQDQPSISQNRGDSFVITWRNWRDGDYDIYAQCYNSNGTPVGSNFRVTNTSKNNQNDPEVRLWNNRIYFTWTDNRAGGTGYDIWANVLEWENQTEKVLKAFTLSQNYPNPFHASTKILYSISKPEFVKLNIYNILGRKIKNLVNETQEAGTYAVNFYAGELSSGIYFYVLQVGSDFTETKKMMFLKRLSAI